MEKRKLKLINYYTDQETGKLYSLYNVRVKDENNKYYYFDSNEHANAFIEQREVNEEAWLLEVPSSLRLKIAKALEQQKVLI